MSQHSQRCVWTRGDSCDPSRRPARYSASNWDRPQLARAVEWHSTCGADSVLAAVAGGAAWLWIAPQPPAPRRIVDFQNYRFGVAPAEFDYDATGSHGPQLAAGRTMWRTYADLFAPSPKLALIQASSLRQLDYYPIALMRDVSAADLMLSVYIKPMGGDLRQSAGLIWRARDRDNYYAAVLDARDGRVRLLRMLAGRPHEIASAAAPIEVEFQRRSPSHERGWYVLRVESVDDHMQVWVGNQRTLSARDASLPRAGRVGLITHADSLALFDDLEIQTGRSGFVVSGPRPRPEPPPPQKLHVAEVVATDALYREPARAFSGDSAFWRVGVRDAQGHPAAAVRVHVDVVGPDGVVRAQPATMTGSDGLALFRYPLRSGESTGVYTVRITGLTHTDRTDALYDPAANVTWTTSFSVDRTRRAVARRGTSDRHED